MEAGFFNCLNDVSSLQHCKLLLDSCECVISYPQQRGVTVVHLVSNLFGMWYHFKCRSAHILHGCCLPTNLLCGAEAAAMTVTCTL